jgi:hypothetical protein
MLPGPGREGLAVLVLAVACGGSAEDDGSGAGHAGSAGSAGSGGAAGGSSGHGASTSTGGSISSGGSGAVAGSAGTGTAGTGQGGFGGSTGNGFEDCTRVCERLPAYCPAEKPSNDCFDSCDRTLGDDACAVALSQAMACVLDTSPPPFVCDEHGRAQLACGPCDAQAQAVADACGEGIECTFP